METEIIIKEMNNECLNEFDKLNQGDYFIDMIDSHLSIKVTNTQMFDLVDGMICNDVHHGLVKKVKKVTITYSLE